MMKRQKGVKICSRHVFDPDLKPTDMNDAGTHRRRQNKYNMLAYDWKIKIYDTLHITEK